MNFEEFNRLCARNQLPEITPENWQELSTTTQGRLILLELSIDDPDLPMPLELIVRSLSPLARTSLKELSYQFNLQRLLDVAALGGMKIFVALHKAKEDPAYKEFIAGFGFEKVPKEITPPPYFSFHVYGSKGALCFSEAQTRKNELTINIEGAVVLGASKNYDWASKIILQFSPEEMFLLLAVLNGKLTEVTLSGHGDKHDKGFEFQLQGGHYFVRLIQRGRSPVSVPMLPTDAVKLTSLIYQQVKKNHPHLSMEMLTVMEDQIVRMRLH